ncbi:MAG: TRAP transporter substrate-binding protein DctP [Deltaproteobacteria bacterium]|nr:TRAP transporter substrate-binding protein DctP [Deltaproteobacteria bacterium]MBW2309019.1 TRAP transporter substrate-binding protein DctP [Deltaproteobacteria bacterium]
MNGKRTITFLAALVLVVFLLISTTTAQAQKVVKWKWMTPLIRPSVQVSTYFEMCKRISERSGGRLVVEPFVFGEHPYKGSDMLGAVRDGLVQMGNTEDVYISSVEPALSIMMVPFMYKSIDHAKKVLEKMIPEVLEPLLNEKYNATLVTNLLITGECVHAKSLLDSFEALKGQKIRVWGKETGDTISLLGGTPVTVAYGELYTAIQRGTINGAMTSMDGAYSSKIHEVAKYVTWWDFAFPWEFTFVNRDALKKLPPDVQKIIFEEGKRCSKIIQRLYETRSPEMLVEVMQKYGVTATALSPEMLKQIQQKIRPVWDDWAKRAGKWGAKALKVYDEVTTSLE